MARAAGDGVMRQEARASSKLTQYTLSHSSTLPMSGPVYQFVQYDPKKNNQYQEFLFLWTFWVNDTAVTSAEMISVH